MSLVSVNIQQFRNVLQAELQLSPGFNLFQGDNGSGKTSLLEAIHFLGLGRSFRTHLVNRIIQHQHDEFTLFANIKGPEGLPIAAGLSKSTSGESRIRVNGESVKSISALTGLLPLQFINHERYQLLDGGPKFRREYMDWLLFHVEPGFFSLWQDFQRLLKQRNMAIRQMRPRSEVVVWDPALIEACSKLTEMRQQCIEALTPYVVTLLKRLLKDAECNFDALRSHYFPGWARDQAYADVLAAALEKDQQLGYTYYGAQRADWVMRLGGVPIHDVLSRGQQKLFICALLLAQGQYLRDTCGKSCLFLLDDLPAELDSHKQQALVSVLTELNAQVMITGVDLSGIKSGLDENVETRVFHVEQGRFNVSETESQ